MNIDDDQYLDTDDSVKPGEIMLKIAFGHVGAAYTREDSKRPEELLLHERSKKGLAHCTV